MFSLFRLQTTDRVFFLVLFLIGCRLALALSPLPYVVPELNLWLTGERLLQGGLLYTDIWTDTPPLTALLYTALSYVAPRSELLSLALATALTLYQALIFNRVCTRFGQVEEHSLMPAAMYILLSHLCFDFTVLSAPQLALTFLLPVLGGVFRHIRVGVEEHRIHQMGLYIGLAAMCYLPAGIMVGVPVLAFLLYTGTRTRWYAVLAIGVAFPFIVAGFVFYFLGGLDGFITCYLKSPFTIPTVGYTETGFLIALFLAPVVLISWAGLRTLTHRGYINYQQVCNTVMLIWGILGLGSYILSTWHQPACFWMMVPSAAYFLAQWSYLIRKAVLRELLLTFFLGYTMMVIYLPYAPLDYVRGRFLAQNLVSFADPVRGGFIGQGRRVLVLGERPTEYLGNALATPFLNRRLASVLLEDSTNYLSQYTVYRHFKQDMPDVIIDADSSLGSIFRRMPILAQYYEPYTQQQGVWVRKK